MSEQEEHQKRTYRTTTKADRERVIAAHENGNRVGAIARMLNMKRQTVAGIIKKFNETSVIEAGLRGGTRAKKLSTEQEEQIRAWIDEDCSISLKKLAAKVHEAFQITVSKTTIAKVIEGFNYTLKRVHKVPVRRNVDETIESRRQYAVEYTTLGGRYPQYEVIFIDEVGFNVSMRDTRGPGKPAVKELPALRARNISVVCAMSRNGIVHYVSRTRAINKEFFVCFIDELHDKLN